MNPNIKLSPPNLGQLTAALVPRELDKSFGVACNASCQFIAAALNGLPGSAREEVLAKITAGSDLNLIFTLKGDGSISAVGSVGGTPFFSITTRRNQARNH
jgi:hypothetical protein